MSTGYVQLLRKNRDFARLWLAQVISLTGDWFNTVVLSALVVYYTRDSGYEGLAVSGFLLARMIPPMLLSPYAGVLVDRLNRKRLLIFSDVTRAAIVLLMLLANSPDRLWLIYVLTICQFSLSSIFEPGRNAIMPSLLDTEDLVTANTLGSVTWSAMLAFGAIVGGIVAATLGMAAALAVDSLSFLTSAALISGITVRELDVERQKARQTSDLGFREGLRYFFQHPNVAAAILVKTMQHFGSIDAVLIIYGTTLFVVGENGTVSMAILWSAFGVGAVLGPLVLNHFTDGSSLSLRRMIGIGFLWITLGWFFFGSSPTLMIATIALVLRAMGGSVTWTYSSVIIQKEVPDEYLGRMFSLDMTGFEFMQAVSTLLVGLFIDQLGSTHVQEIVIGMGVVSIFPLMAWWLAITRRDRVKNGAPAIGD